MLHLSALILLATPPAAGTPSPVAVIERELAAYNAHDLDAFVACFAPDAALYDLGGGDAPVQRGRDAIRARYARRFQLSPDIHVEIHGRLRAGPFVTDHEVLPNGVEAIVVYQVEGGLIRRMWAALTR